MGRLLGVVALHEVGLGLGILALHDTGLALGLGVLALHDIGLALGLGVLVHEIELALGLGALALRDIGFALDLALLALHDIGLALDLGVLALRDILALHCRGSRTRRRTVPAARRAEAIIVIRVGSGAGVPFRIAIVSAGDLLGTRGASPTCRDTSLVVHAHAGRQRRRHAVVVVAAVVVLRVYQPANEEHNDGAREMHRG